MPNFLLITSVCPFNRELTMTFRDVWEKECINIIAVTPDNYQACRDFLWAFNIDKFPYLSFNDNVYKGMEVFEWFIAQQPESRTTAKIGEISTKDACNELSDIVMGLK